MRAIILAIALFVSGNVLAQGKEMYLLVGTYTSDIHVYKFNTQTGTISPVSKIGGNDNPSYLAITSNGKYVYAVNEKPGGSGEASAFSFDKKKGELKLINRVASGGDGPCFVDVDSAGDWVATGNYQSGCIGMLKTNADGSLQQPVQVIQHQGYSVNVTRQEKPHVHCAVFSPDGKFVFSNDLGTDKIYTYPFTPGNLSQPLDEENVTTTDVPDGSGPRHMAFHPNRKFFYVINEMAGTLIAYQYNNGKLTELQNIASDNTKTKADKGSADIHITPDGKYLYTSNRASANDITIYRIATNGTLTELGHQSTLGVHPRNFTIDPTGKFLLVANRDTNNIVVFTIYKSTGLLSPTGVQIQVDKPVCLKMTPVQ